MRKDPEAPAPNPVPAPPPLLCHRPGCTRSLPLIWETSEPLCDPCALERDLYDRSARWRRLAAEGRRREVN